MKWMANLKIRTKLLLGFGVVLAFVIFLATLSIVKLVRIDRDYTYALDQFVVPRMEAIKDAELRLSELRRTISVIGIYVGRDDKIASAEPYIHEAYEALREPFDRYIELVNTDPKLGSENKNIRVNRVNEVLSLIDTYYNTIVTGIIQETRNNDVDAVHALITDATALVDEMSIKIDEIVKGAERYRVEISDLCSSYARQAFVLLVVVTVLAIVFSLIIIYVITRSVTIPVKELTNLFAKVAVGNLDVNAVSDTRDEIGGLTRDVAKVVDVVRSLVSDINFVSNEFDKGEIDTKIDENKYQGSYRDVASGFNRSLRGVVNEALHFIRCVTDFSEGDFEADIPKLPGKKATMNTSRNQLRDNLMGINNDIARLVQQASAGNLNTTIDATKYKGDWSKLAESLNGLMRAISIPIGETLASLTEFSNGNLNVTMTGEYKGQFGEIKECMNNTMGTVESYIHEIAVILENVAKDNDLTQEISRHYVGDFEQIKESINMIVRRMNRVMNDFNAASEQVSSGARMIAESSMSLAEGATEQASSVEELSASIETINEQTTKSATDAEGANNLAVSSRENALKGNEEMKKMLVSMGEIKTSSDNISKINKVIEDIAFQTNLLALNAAVEAARAGTHGKGFAVVAEEVRNLASRSQHASKETSELIQASIQKVSEGQQIAESTAETLEKIVNDFTKVSTIISGIATSSKEQAGSIQQISIGLGQISEVVQSNSSTSEESAATAQELSGQSEVLRNMVSEFKTH